MGRKDEALLAQQIADWMLAQYPNVPYRFDLAADIYLTPGQAMRNKRLHPFRGYLDLHIVSPSAEYHGAFIEIKAEGKGPYLKDGHTLKKDKHLEEQAAWIEWLTALGYFARFATGFIEAQAAIRGYLAMREPHQIVKGTPKVVELYLEDLARKEAEKQLKKLQLA